MARIIWFIIFVLSFGEILLSYKDWFGYLRSGKATLGGMLKNYIQLAVKVFIPGVLALLGVMAAFIH